MRVSESIDSVQENVRDLLVTYPEVRDNDKLLWLVYLNIHYQLKESMSSESYKRLKDTLLDSSIPSMDTLSRARRKVQEREVDLAGEKRKNRKAEAVDMKNWALKNK